MLPEEAVPVGCGDQRVVTIVDERGEEVCVVVHDLSPC